ncbi:hypothetical protein BCIN_13g05310 [Botrytis cinerea B05.10]|uniref:Uncharacterized protein n=3 Tax=Botryotinia fuckeliana TaxID=40559 RepID=A0A384K1I5_BOTFB|nr:hypothetical protein BCIN_13g05310 [Botrytis cinerea B05.10]ATZ56696.1 hypothetical protein BCIN_13g05310 [Botrytis cinerea B05.10]EMR87376.1 hypothetical protein BcDW1_4010 [Botrytis cinerea BcDW1]CCD48247.1 hypothetical protein BofuT4_P035400.1 [Botrytis cinerea T4]
MPAIMPIAGFTNGTQPTENFELELEWLDLLKIFLLTMAFMGLVLAFVFSLDWICLLLEWINLSIEKCQEKIRQNLKKQRKAFQKKQEAARKEEEAAEEEGQPILNPRKFKNTPDDVDNRKAKNLSNGQLRREQERGIVGKDRELPVEKRQVDYGTITI